MTREASGGSNIIPLSPALDEASSESLSDFLSRPPESYSQSDLNRIIETLRAQRIRWLQAEGKKASSGEPKARKASPKARSSQTPEDLGL